MGDDDRQRSGRPAGGLDTPQPTQGLRVDDERASPTWSASTQVSKQALRVDQLGGGQDSDHVFVGVIGRATASARPGIGNDRQLTAILLQ